jgi:hypothetical protein
MVRSIAVASLVLLLSSSPLSAQALGRPFGHSKLGDGTNPFATWCSSPAMTHCASIWTWEFGYWTDGVSPWGEASFRTDLEVTHNDDGLFEIYAVAVTSDGFFADMWTNVFPNVYSVTGWRAHGGDSTMGPIIRATDVGDPMLLYWSDGEFCRTGDGLVGLGSTWKRCVSVPEPNSPLLLASGIFGLAYVRRRRAA